jgi:RNA polymerase sigma factor (sigma-70 family)
VPLEAEDISGLYRRHARGMVGFFARRTYDPEAAVDLVAETFAAAFRDRARFRGAGEQQAVAWLYGIAHHQLSGFYRHGDVERRAVRRLGIERRGLTDPEYERIEELAGLREARRRVAAEIAQLPDDQAAAIRLRVVEELDYDEVAARLGVSEQTVRARVSRGLRAMAARIDPSVVCKGVGEGA